MTIRELEELIAEYGKDILSFCVHLTGSKAEGEELYQEVFVCAMDKLSLIRTDQNPKSYLLGMAWRLWTGGRRKLARRSRLVPLSAYEASAEDVTASMEDSYEERENKLIVQKAVHELPELYRLVILLFYMEELSLSEISEMLGVPKGTVASRLHKAKELLRERLEDCYGKI